MRKILFIAIVFFIILSPLYSPAAEWKFSGGLTISGEEMITFYDTESLNYLPNGNVQVWSKIIRQSVFESKFTNIEKDIIKKSADKISSGYSPPYSLVQNNLSSEDYMDIITWEVLANYYNLQPYGKTLNEINCQENKIRTLTVTIFKDNGEIKDSKKLSREWDYISPESNGEILKKILCK